MSPNEARKILDVTIQRDAHFTEIQRARKIIETIRDQRHTLCVALMAAEATLTMLAGATKNTPHREERRAETVKIVRAALQESGYSCE